ncbi:MAG: helix-turn-helix domain-containing protein [Hyphomonas sp.]
MKHDTPLFAPPHKLRPGSDRALRFIRLAWLIGRRISEIAALLQVSRSTVSRHLTRHNLRGPGRPGEVARLLAEVIVDRAADLVVSEEPVTPEPMFGLLQKITGSMKVMAQLPEPAKTEEDGTTTTDDWRIGIEDEIERLVAMERAMAEGGDAASAGRETAAGLETKSHKAPPLPARVPRYAGAAAGPFADVAAFGRTWRRQDAGGRGMGAMGGAAGRIPPGGAGGADLLGCTRGDDRGPERPDLDGAAQG